MGLAAALGFEFFDSKGEKISPVGASLNNLESIIVPKVITSARFSLACDVNNPLYGKLGAAHVYARQKGADDAMILQLDDGLKNLASVIEKSSGKSIQQIPGAGAAGGIASFLLAYFNCEMKSGIERIVEQTGFHQLLSEADWLVTGEGCIDEQSLQGKLVGTLLKHANNAGKKTLLVCGQAPSGIRSTLGDIPLLSLLEFTKNEATAMQQAAQLLPPLVHQFFSSI
jgi:glycerate kinase